MKSMRNLFIVLIVSLAIAFFWDKLAFIRQIVDFVLEPTAGILLDWHVTLGLIIITGIITLIITLVQKYTTDQETLRALKKEQKDLQKQFKEYKDNPEKMMELNKKQMTMMKEMMEISMRPIVYTSIPIILFFRWFHDYFSVLDVKIFGFLSWFWAYLLLAIIFSTIFRKMFNVA